MAATAGEASARIEIVGDRRRAYDDAFRTMLLAEAGQLRRRRRRKQPTPATAYPDGYYWIINSEGMIRIAWFEDGWTVTPWEDDEPIADVFVLQGPPFPTQQDVTRWLSDPVMRERHLMEMKRDNAVKSGYYWVWPRDTRPLLAYFIEEWYPIREDATEISIENESSRLAGLLLFGPLEEPPIPDDVLRAFGVTPDPEEPESAP